MEQIKISEIDALVKKHDYTVAGLYDAQGRTVVALNAGGMPIGKKLTQIKNRLKNLDDGYYTIRFQHNLGSKYPKYDKLIVIGNMPMEEGSQIIIPGQKSNAMNSNTENIRSYDKALADATRIVALESELQRLKDQQQEEPEEEEEENTLMEQGKSFLTEALPQLLPSIDKYFETKKMENDTKNRELDLREQELKMRISGAVNPQLRTVHPFRPVPAVNDAENFEKYCKWLLNAPEDIFQNELAYLEDNLPETFKICYKVCYPDPQQQSNA